MMNNKTASGNKYRMSSVRLTENEYGVYDLDSDRYFKVLGTGPVLSVHEAVLIKSESWQGLDNDSIHDAILAYINGQCKQEDDDKYPHGTMMVVMHSDRVLLALLKMAVVLANTLEHVTDREDERLITVELCQISQSLRDYVEDLQ